VKTPKYILDDVAMPLVEKKSEHQKHHESYDDEC
jgi:hypothetical protein